MTAKEIQNVIKNENHQRLTSALNDKCAEIAREIREAMYKLQVTKIGDYWIRTNSSNSGHSEEFLCVDYRSLERDRPYCFAGDYYCKTYPASRKEKLAFINKAKEIFEMLSEMQDEECEAIEKALAQFKD